MTLVLAATVAACGGGGDDTPTGTTPTLDLAISVSTLTVQQGGSGTATVTITRGGGLTANVDLSVEGAPTGVTTTLTPASLGSGVTSSSLSVNVAAGAAVEERRMIVRAKARASRQDGDDCVDRHGRARRRAPSHSAASAVTGSIAQGGSGTSTITVARTGAFTGPVLSRHRRADWPHNHAQPDQRYSRTTSTLTISPAATTTPGTYTLTVTGTGNRCFQCDYRRQRVVTVAQATGGSGNVTFTFCCVERTYLVGGAGRHRRCMDTRHAGVEQ